MLHPQAALGAVAPDRAHMHGISAANGEVNGADYRHGEAGEAGGEAAVGATDGALPSHLASIVADELNKQFSMFDKLKDGIDDA